MVAKVNGVEIREGDIKLAEEDIGQQMTQVPPESKRDYLVTYVGDMILLTQAAEAKKIGDSDEFKQQLEFTRKKLLMAKLLDSEAKAASTEAAMRKIYDDATKQMKPEEEVHARHILVETEEEAKAMQEELKKGADFAELAKSKSKDPGAAAEGGDLGFFSKDQMVPEFAEAAFKLEKGQTLRPGEVAFWLAHHPGRGKAHAAAAGLRAGQAATRDIRHAQGTVGIPRQAARRRQDRAPRQAGERQRAAAAPAGADRERSGACRREKIVPFDRTLCNACPSLVPGICVFYAVTDNTWMARTNPAHDDDGDAMATKNLPARSRRSFPMRQPCQA